MKFQTYLNNSDEIRFGFLIDNNLFDLQNEGKRLNIEICSNVNEFLEKSEENIDKARKIEYAIKQGFDTTQIVIPKQILSPVPKPSSMRDGYAFRQHVEAARRNRGVEMIPEFDEYPVFYFTNHNAVFGQGNIIVEKDHLEKCDFELEWAIVIGKEGKNINAQEADSYILGYTIMNDLSARLLQMEEMKLNLGPAKGKDFATSLGPVLVTPDELENKSIPSNNGLRHDLLMKAYHNGIEVSSGKTKDMNWTFAEIIERASYGVTLYPGDVIGSGTVGTGCYLELNGTRLREAKDRGENYEPVWLKDNDTITLEVEGIGKLENRIIMSNDDVSILAKKKKRR